MTAKYYSAEELLARLSKLDSEIEGQKKIAENELSALRSLQTQRANLKIAIVKTLNEKGIALDSGEKWVEE